MNGKNAIAVLIVNPLNEILCQLRDNKPGILNPGMWGIIGGTVERNEFPEEAAYRELHEEIEYKPDNLTFFRNYIIENDCVYVFIVRVPFTDSSLLHLNEGQELRFFNKKQILDLSKNGKTCHELSTIITDFYSESKSKNLLKKL